MKKQPPKPPAQTPLQKPLVQTLGVVVIVFALVQLTRWVAISENVASSNLRLIQEFGQVKAGVMQFGEDMNEVRDYLLLPRKAYDFFPEPQAGEPVTDPLATQLFQFTETVGDTAARAETLRQSEEALRGLLKNDGFKAGLAQRGLIGPKKLEENDTALVYRLYKKDDAFLALTLDRQSGAFTLQSIGGKAPLAVAKDQDLAATLLSYLTANQDRIATLKTRLPAQNEALIALFQDKEVAAVLNQRQWQVNFNPVETEAGYEFGLQNNQSEPVLSVMVDRQSGDFVLGGAPYVTAEALKPALITSMKSLQVHSEREAQVAEAQAKLKAILESPAFGALLQKARLELKEPRPENDKIIYDLVSTVTAKPAGTIEFESLTGNVFVKTGAEKTPINLLDWTPDGSKKNG